jgi:hypothetical protein
MERTDVREWVNASLQLLQQQKISAVLRTLVLLYCSILV